MIYSYFYRISSGHRHTSFIDEKGKVYCWGHNGQNQCFIPSSLGKAKAIASGFFHTVCVLETGQIIGWGG